MNSAIPGPDIAWAARELVDRYGANAVAEAAARAVTLASEGRWREHDVAMRLLTVVERLVGRP